MRLNVMFMGLLAWTAAIGVPALYAAAILLSYVNPLIALAIYAGVAVMWFIPDQRIEKTLRS